MEKKEIEEIPAILREKRTELADTENTVLNLQKELDLLKLGVKAAVAGERTEEGKPLFSNEMLREAEAQARYKADSVFSETKEKIKNLKCLAAVTKIEVQYHQDRLKVAEILAQLGGGI